MESVKLSIIIINYNVTDLLRACLRSIERFVEGFPYEVLVVDNASPDLSWQSLMDEFPKVKFFSLPENLGFSKANNFGVKQAIGEYILLLNPDTEIETQGLEKVLKFADNQKDFGCLGVRMHNLNGDFLPESKRSVPNLKNSFEKLFLPFSASNSKRKNYYRNDIEETEIAEVEVVTGAFLLAKRFNYLQIGGLDERYFMYGEDIDICYTFLQKGFKNYYYGDFSILHHKGQSTIKDEKYLENFYGAMQIFLDKYYKNQSPKEYKILAKGLKIKYILAKMKLNTK